MSRTSFGMSSSMIEGVQIEMKDASWRGYKLVTHRMAFAEE